MSGFDLLSAQALEKLSAWPAQARKLFDELVEDASSEMQRELLSRAVAAGHSPAEIHAFADELRVLDDQAVFEACTLDANAPEGYSVAQLLGAEADPLYAYELKGNLLSPAEDGAWGTVGHRSPTLDLELQPDGRASSFDSGPQPSVVKQVDSNPGVDASPMAAAPVSARLMDDLLNASTRGLGVLYREQDVDDAQLTLEAALGVAAVAVGQGIPVPVALGPALTRHRRLALLLQLATPSGKRAWQIYDPLSGELYWVSEGDLLARTELPFSNKTNRRITRIALPVLRAGAQ